MQLLLEREKGEVRTHLKPHQEMTETRLKDLKLLIVVQIDCSSTGKIWPIIRHESIHEILSYAYIGQVDWPSNQSTEYKSAQSRNPLSRTKWHTFVNSLDSLHLK